MQKRHQDALTQRIEEVVHRGHTRIEWWEIYLWYEAQRIGKGIWRDLKERFDEMADDDDATLWVYSSTDTKGVMLIHSDGLEEISAKISGAE